MKVGKIGFYLRRKQILETCQWNFTSTKFLIRHSTMKSDVCKQLVEDHRSFILLHYPVFYYPDPCPNLQ